MIRFFKNLWYFFVADFGKIHKLHGDFYQMKAQIAELELYKRKLIDEKATNQELRQLNRRLENKSDREVQFEEKATILTKLNRWANEVEIGVGTKRELALMMRVMEGVHDRLPQPKIKAEVIDKSTPREEKKFGLATTMK